MADNVAQVTDATFTAEVLESELPVLVDFTADWCPPCRMIAPVLDAVAVEEGHRVKVVQVNVDTSPELRAAYAVMSMPTLIVFQGGEPVKSMVGARAKAKLLRELAEVI